LNVVLFANVQALPELQQRERSIRSLMQTQKAAVNAVQAFKSKRLQQLATNDDAVDVDAIDNANTGTAGSVSEAAAAAIQALLDANEENSGGQLASNNDNFLANRSVTQPTCSVHRCIRLLQTRQIAYISTVYIYHC
jgi:hypothetical protein